MFAYKTYDVTINNPANSPESTPSNFLWKICMLLQCIFILQVTINKLISVFTAQMSIHYSQVIILKCIKIVKTKHKRKKMNDTNLFGHNAY